MQGKPSTREKEEHYCSTITKLECSFLKVIHTLTGFKCVFFVRLEVTILRKYHPLANSYDLINQCVLHLIKIICFNLYLLYTRFIKFQWTIFGYMYPTSYSLFCWIELDAPGLDQRSEYPKLSATVKSFVLRLKHRVY